MPGQHVRADLRRKISEFGAWQQRNTPLQGSRLYISTKQLSLWPWSSSQLSVLQVLGRQATVQLEVTVVPNLKVASMQAEHRGGGASNHKRQSEV